MNNKTLAIVSYITIFGWLFSWFSSKDQNPKDQLVTYHLKQALGIGIISILLAVVLNVIVRIIPSLYFLGYAQYAIVVLWVLGILNASAEKMIPVPVVGKVFENKFDFLEK